MAISLWKKVSIAKKLYFVVGIMAVLILIELLTLRFAMDKLSAVRAFVGGEGLWSKAQKNAVYQLQRYALTKNEEDYQAFKKALVINDGDSIARLELQKPYPNMSIVKKGFVQGHNHPDDVEPMVHLLQDFYWISYIENAVASWTEADVYLQKLKLEAENYHQLVQKKDPDINKQLVSLGTINDINENLTQIEEDFSGFLGEGSRFLEKVVLLVLFSIVLTVECVGFTLTFFTSRSLTKGLRNLITGAQAIGKGNFKEKIPVLSQDEIGELTIEVNSMGTLIAESQAELEKKVQERTLKLDQIAKENERLYQEASAAVKMRDEFLSIASHELKTPLTAMSLQLQLLERLTKDENPKIQSYAASAFAHARKLASLHEVLLDLTRIRLGSLELKLLKSDLVSIGLEALSQISHEAANRGIHIDIKAPRPVPCMVDHLRIGQVINNLLSNALKYGNGHPILLQIFEEQSQGVIQVKDIGPGIPDDKKELIFERYERISNEMKESSFGLGLYISRQIIEAHGGTLKVHDHSPRGSIFEIRLPLQS